MMRMKGQIATFLIILMAAILVMAMFISNLGQLSNAAVEVANATDGAALSLGSQLATKSNELCKTLSQKNEEGATKCSEGKDGLEFSQRTGLLGVFLAIIVVAAVAIFAPAALPAVGHLVAPMLGTTAAAAVGGAMVGAAAGAVGGGIAGTGAGVGALQGASIGAGIGGGAAAAAAASGLHAVGLGILAVGGPTGRLYSDIRQGNDVSESMGAISQSLSGLPDYERMREQTLLKAMSQTIDDPNRTVGPGGSGCYFPTKYGPAVGDPFDVNNNGNTTESISCFDYWWSVRVNQLKAAMVSRTDLVKRFIEGPWNGEATAGTLRDRRDKARSLLPLLERREVECHCLSDSPIPSEGITVEFWRRLYNAGCSFCRFPEIFQPGPDQAAVRSFMDGPDQLTAPAGWDSLDAVQYQYGQFLAWADAMVWNPILHASQFGSSDGLYQHLAQTVDNWLPMLYDPKATADEYHRLEFIQNETTKWFVTARYGVILQMDRCHLAYGPYPQVFSTEAKNPPACDNTQLVVNPSTGRQEDRDPIDNCTFVNNSSPSNLTTGPHFPNKDFNPDWTSTFPGPMCKIDLTQRMALEPQLDRLEHAVRTLPDYIQANSATYFDNPTCDSPPPPYNDTRVVTQPTLVSIDQIALNKWPKPKDTDDKLEFMYRFQYDCQNCVTDKGVTDCDPNTTYSHPEPRSGQSLGAIGTPDLAIMAQASDPDGGRTAQDKLLNPEDGILLKLRGLLPKDYGDKKLNDLAHVFGTVVADPETDLKDALTESFLNHSQQYRYNEAKGEWEGKGALEYFLLQVKEFDRQLHDALSVQPAKDGRLPNPQQPMNDPIGGGTHSVDGKYTWQDSRGKHTVIVDIGPFITAELEPFHSGNSFMGREGLRLKNYCDNSPGCPYKGPDRTWVRIKREDPNDPNDPSDPNAGWWKWNPFGTTITKAARVSYDRRAIKLCGTGGSECP